MLADDDFGPLEILIESLPGGPLVNISSANENDPDIERKFIVVKEQCRDSCHGLPFQIMPKLLTTHKLLNTVKMLNFFTTKGGIS